MQDQDHAAAEMQEQQIDYQQKKENKDKLHTNSYF